MVVLFIFGIVSLILGTLFLMGKENMDKLDKLMNKVIIKSDKDVAYKYNKILGFALVVLAVVFICIGLTLKK